VWISAPALGCYGCSMNISEETREQIIREHRSKIAKKARDTLLKRRGVSYFKRLGKKGGSKPKRRAA
jgi:hypothetical protein